MKILFMGTPDFAVPTLEALVQHGHEVAGVITQPDKPKGRGMKMTYSPVKEAALKLNLPVYQPETLRGYAIKPMLEEMKPDAIVVVAYGNILPPYVLKAPKYGCINVHGSLLPKYRGAGPIQAAVINGESETGVTTMFMAKGLDTGDMLLSAATPIGIEDTAETVHDRLMVMGAELLIKTLAGLEAGTVERIPQDDALSNYAPMLTKDDGRMIWSQPASKLYDRARGVTPWPGAFTSVDGNPVKLAELHLGDITSDAPCGTVVEQGTRVYVVCGDGKTLEIGKIQPAGRKMVAVADYLRGNKLPERFDAE